MEKFSFLNAIHSEYIAELYEQYTKYPDSIEPSWRAFFQGFDFANTSYNGHSLTDGNTSDEVINQIPEKVQKEFKVIQLIDAYRSRGHLFTKTNPVRERRQHVPTLELSNFGLTESDLNETFKAGSIIGIDSETTLNEIIQRLTDMFCTSIGVEYMHIDHPDKSAWIQNWINHNLNRPKLSVKEKERILLKLNEAVAFENFLHTKFVGQKRFSLEGNESLIPALDTVINRAADAGVEEVFIGMAHRGRLNVLANIMKKSYSQIFSEFEAKEFADDIFAGDVKYHLGSSTNLETFSGKEIKVNLAPNPSHLETVNSIVQGITRAKVDLEYKGDFNRVLPILIHGDAAIAAQGIVYEVAQMMTLDGYKTGGTVHIIVNNQIGFTTNYLDGRSSIYCTDIAKVTQSPVIHVNSDDAEAVVHALHFAADYRMRFGEDVYIDLLGYRKYGHNEGDEPRFTQPKLYKAIARHKNPRDIYAEKLIAQGVIDAEYTKKLEDEYLAKLEEALEISKTKETTTVTRILEEEWKGYETADGETMMKPVDTRFDIKELDKIAKVITRLPEGKKFIRKTDRLIDSRYKMYFENNKLDWAMGELLD